MTTFVRDKFRVKIIFTICYFELYLFKIWGVIAVQLGVIYDSQPAEMHKCTTNRSTLLIFIENRLK